MKVQDIKELYLGYWGRAADMDGLNYWIVQASQGMSIETMAKNFAASNEATETYSWLKNSATPNQTDAIAFVTEIYDNTLMRKPDAAGLDYWATQLSSGKVTADQIILNVTQGAHSDIVVDLPMMEEKIYLTEIIMGEVVGGNVKTALETALQSRDKTIATVNAWVDQYPHDSYESYYNAYHAASTNEFMNVYNTWTTTEKQAVMTDAQEAVIDVQLVGVTPIF